MKPVAQENLTTYASFAYKKDGQDKSDLIGVINLEVPVLTVNIDTFTASREIRLTGVADGGEELRFLIDGAEAGRIITKRDGQYSMPVTLPEKENGHMYTVTAEMVSNPQIRKEVTVFYQQEIHELTEFKMYYNAHTSKCLDLMSLQGQTSVSLYPGHPFTFTIKFDHGANLRNVYVVSTKNGVETRMKAEATASPGEYIASGYFDPDNPNYVPGYLSLAYETKSDIESFETELDLTAAETTMPDSWKNAEIGEVVTREEGDVTTQSSTITLQDEFGTQLEVEKTTTELHDVNVKEYLARNGYEIVTDNTGKQAAVRVSVSDTSVYESYISLGDVDFGAEIAKSLFKEEITVRVFGQDSMAGLLFDGGMLVINTMGYVLDYALMYQQIQSANLTEAQRQAALEKLELMGNYYIAKTLLSYVSFAVPAIIGVTFPYSLGITVATLLLEQEINQLFEAWLNDTNYYPLRWLIDPSGYVYEAVTSNRLEGARLTIYYRETMDSPETLWDATEYSQENPLYSDAEGLYAWDVPEGFWKVVSEAEGYETWSSEWMEVPPVRTDVNVAMISRKAPVLSVLGIHEQAVELVFDRYLIPETVESIVVQDSLGQTIPCTVFYDKTETAADGTVYARKYELIPADGSTLKDGEEYTVFIPDTVTSYAGIPAAAAEKKAICEPKLSLEAQPAVSVKYGERIEIPITVMPADSGRNLQASTLSTDFIKVVEIKGTENAGNWIVTVEGRLPGEGELFLAVEGTDLEESILVQVEMNPEFAGFEEEPEPPETEPEETEPEETEPEETESEKTEPEETESEETNPPEQQKTSIHNCTVQAISQQTYRGSALTPVVVVKDGSFVLQKGVHYTVSYQNNVNAGTASAVIRGMGDYTGTLTTEFVIQKATRTITLPVSYGKTYGDAPFILDGKVSQGDGTLTYQSNNPSVARVDAAGKVTIVGAGTAVITVSVGEIQNYSGAQVQTRIEVEKASQTIEGVKDYQKSYKDKAFSLNITVSSGQKPAYRSSNEKAVKVDANGNVDVVDIGKSLITISVPESTNYKAVTAQCEIEVGKAAGTIRVKHKFEKVYGTKAFRLGAKLEDGRKLTYKSKNRKVAVVSSAGKVTVKGIGSAVIEISAKETSKYKAIRQRITVQVNPKATRLTRVSSPSKGRMKVSWKRISGVTGYQIRYSMRSNMTKGRTLSVKGYRTISKTIRGLRKGKRYYVQVRTYKKVGRKSYYSNWSSKKKIIIRR